MPMSRLELLESREAPPAGLDAGGGHSAGG